MPHHITAPRNRSESIKIQLEVQPQTLEIQDSGAGFTPEAEPLNVLTAAQTEDENVVAVAWGWLSRGRWLKRTVARLNWSKRIWERVFV